MTRPRIPSVLDDALAFNLDRVATFFRRELMEALADYDLTPEQWQLMSVLWGNEGGLSQQEITDLLAKDKHNISRMIRRLEAKGWLERQPDPADARALTVRTTPLGSSLQEPITRTLDNHFGHLDLGLSDAERTRLVKMLKVLRTRLRDG